MPTLHAEFIMSVLPLASDVIEVVALCMGRGLPCTPTGKRTCCCMVDIKTFTMTCNPVYLDGNFIIFTLYTSYLNARFYI
jgi:hypothetical protein